MSGLSDQVRAAIANNVRHARRTRGLSIRDLADRSGFSKAMLSQLERGLANPTVEVLSGIAESLELSFADITRTPLYEPQVMRRAPGDEVGAASARTLLSSLDRRRFEVYESSLPAEHTHESAPHGRGSEEFAYVLSGAVTLEIATWTVRLRAGDAVRFSAEAEHSYRTATRPARLLTLVSMPTD
ncbi:helix-turn-helix domain-containing protein [Planotetraspora sp. GP83]|uniref:helix-turn-helix domain-containing protein n=1 Tax=Planotetraspora sp. GP83 TaxID=3156264 RepID=UPI0035159864